MKHKKFPFEMLKGAILVSANVTGTSAATTCKLILDTGASKTMLSPEVLISLGYRSKDSTKKLVVTTAKGNLLAEQYQLSSFKAFGLIRQNFEVISHHLPAAFLTLGIDGLLGLDFISNRELCIDMHSKQISFS